MADNTAKITALEDAIALGALRVSFDGQSIQYRSIKDMLQTLTFLKNSDDSATVRTKSPIVGLKSMLGTQD